MLFFFHPLCSYKPTNICTWFKNIIHLKSICNLLLIIKHAIVVYLQVFLSIFLFIYKFSFKYFYRSTSLIAVLQHTQAHLNDRQFFHTRFHTPDPYVRQQHFFDQLPLVWCAWCYLPTHKRTFLLSITSIEGAVREQPDTRN